MSEERFWSLVNQLRENYRVGAHTRSKCSRDGCKNRASGGKCGECCAKELGELTGDEYLARLLMFNIKENLSLLNQMLERLEDAG